MKITREKLLTDYDIFAAQLKNCTPRKGVPKMKIKLREVPEEEAYEINLPEQHITFVFDSEQNFRGLVNYQ